MTPVATFALLLAASLGLLVALMALVVGRKALRDRREDRSTRRRRRLAAALASGEPRELRRALLDVRGAQAQVDLAVELQRAPAWPADLPRAALRSGLVRRLERQLHSRRPAGRGRAVLILAHLQIPGGLARLEDRLDDDDPDVRLVAVAGLPLAEDPQAVKAMVRALSHRRLAPERVIEKIGRPWAVEALLQSLADLDTEGERRAAPRVGIARALGVAGDRRAEPALIALLEQGAPEARISAARALGSAGGPAARLPLEAALRDDAWPLRAQAAKALGEIGDPAAAPALESVLGDRAWWVRANAATSLRRLGPPGLEVLERALEHPDAYARDRAREALALERVGAA